METDDLHQIDLEAYAANYTGLGKVQRLLFVAKNFGGTPLEPEALRLLAIELKKGLNTHCYTDVMQAAGSRLGPQYKADEGWVSATHSRAVSEQTRLEHLLTGSKTSLRKEAIRQGHIELALLHKATGNLQEAFKCFVRTRDYCSTPQDVLQMCLHVVTTALHLRQWANVHNYATKAEGTADIQRDPVLAGKIKCAEALAFIEDGKYRSAARKLVEVPPEMGSSYSEVLSVQDVAIWGSLCALASFSRGDLKRLVVDSLSFREYLESVPEVRDMVNEFAAARFSAALDRLVRLEQHQLRIDQHLAPHLEALKKALRARALVQYTQSFAAVQLSSLAATFACTSEDIEADLARLIKEGQIKGRIDAAAGVLYARRDDPRAAGFKAALAAGEDYLYNMQATVLRASLVQHDLIQRPAMLGGKKGMGFREMM